MSDTDDNPRRPGLARPHRRAGGLSAASTREELAASLARLGHTTLSALDEDRAYEAFCEVAAAKAEVTVRDLEALVDDRLRAIADQYQLLRLETRTRTGEPAWARVELLERGIEIAIDAEGTGDGPIDAALQAVVSALHIEAALLAFSVEALSTGTDALCEAHVTVAVAGVSHQAEGVAASLTEAGVRAFLAALSHARRAERHGP